ncbi:hypothetical protein QWY84_13600 [Aquisalimonas lutea]|uniref:hypothetical protein n=1 Tax=Aquisalimonas lutea TaxID=1327750 RepID=UPI0025B49AB7|nr:hypothetical protein [Aquisalimonas lutea]MDN3518650.1 hypothetical protein [Aquisalimonas lutea]
MSDTESSGNLLHEPERSLAEWLSSHALALAAMVAVTALLGYAGFQVSTGGYELTGGVVLVAAITVGCHAGEWLRRGFLRQRGRA